MKYENGSWRVTGWGYVALLLALWIVLSLGHVS